MTSVQIIRDLTHAFVIVRGADGKHAISLERFDVKPDSARVRKLIKRVKVKK